MSWSLRHFTLLHFMLNQPAEKAGGTIGVIGPTRMPYGRTISTLGYLASVLSGLVAELYGREIAPRPGGYDAN